ncbi:J domain-containing protein [Luteolibacter marinus]|uniref:J domain-containing protein n=1 Tax=Luteolibacter marinus TaxID=2776705 RepID=UPI001866EC88|nr:J domain-containing protein [Luteolibacter marinus]
MDPFERLGLERRLALSEEELREAFRTAGKQGHPDAGGSGEDFALLQQAYRQLSRPSGRLRAWLSARGIPGEDRGAISPRLLDLFGTVGAVLQRADAVAKKRGESHSALAKAMLEPEVQETREALEACLGEVAAALQDEETAFPEIEAGDGDPWLTVRNLAFLEKWQGELKARFSALW